MKSINMLGGETFFGEKAEIFSVAWEKFFSRGGSAGQETFRSPPGRHGKKAGMLNRH